MPPRCPFINTWRTTMQSNTINSTPSTEPLNFQTPCEPSTSQSAAVNRIASNLGRSCTDEIKRQIISKCDAINNEAPAVRPKTRIELSEYLMNNKVLNAEGLNPHQRHICAWVLMDHAVRAQPFTVSANQLRTFVNPEQRPFYARMACNMGLKAAKFAE